MPKVIQGNRTSGNSIDIREIDADYSDVYPEGVDLTPGSEIHNRLVDEILHRASDSHDIMSQRYDSWNKIDEVLTAYIPVDEAEKAVKEGDPRKPTSILFPYSYAMMETTLTYLMNAFLQYPMFRYEGQSPEDTVGAALLERVIQFHTEKSKVGLNLHTMFRDNIAYGLGVVHPTWEIKHGTRTMKHTDYDFVAGGQTLETGQSRKSESAILFEGNALQNVDVYSYLPDPNIPVQEAQNGEFVGWVVRDNYMNLLVDENNKDTMFNVRYLRALNDATSQYAEDNSNRELKTTNNADKETASGTTNRVDVIHMYVHLIPAEWGLGDKEDPERWYFQLAGDDVIIAAGPANFDHNLFPVAVAASEFDGYSALPVSRMEIIYGLQSTLDWLFNSHITNVRKAINDMLIVDPYLININDLKDPQPGKLIRMRRPAWGRGVTNAVQQLNVNDITRANMADSAYMTSWMEKIMGVDGASMGSLRSGGPDRLTAAEFQGTQAGGVSRMERMARVIGLQAMQDIGYMFASHTKQLMTEDVYVKTTGRWQETLLTKFGVGAEERVKASPFDLLIDYDVMPRDGSVPGGNFNAQTWTGMFETMSKSPELMAQFDMVRLFKYIAIQSGAKNVDDFDRRLSVQPEMVPDAEIQRKVAEGSIIPANQVG